MPYVRFNNDIIFSQAISGGGTVQFVAPTTLYNVGDWLYFGVSSNGADYNDTTLLSGTFTSNAAPEPVSSLLFGVGAIAVGLRRKFAKK